MVLICISLISSNVELFLCVPVSHLDVFSGEMSIQVFCAFSDWVIFFDTVLYVYVGCIVCKYFLSFHRLSFYSVDGFLCCAKAFKFN